MKTNPIDFYNALQYLNDANKPQFAILLPTDETIYEVDLNTRTIKAPKYLSVKTDHYAETVYFLMDRFHDNMDMATTVCTIQYINDGIKTEGGDLDQGHMYLVPFYDITTYQKEKKMLIPWQISGIATQAAGNVTFSLRFFQLSDIQKDGKQLYIYSLNTQPATSKVLHGLDLNLEENDNIYVPADQVTQIYNRIDQVSKQSVLYWVDA